MKAMAFTSRNIKELVRDPISYIFCLGLPIAMLIIMTLINESIPDMEEAPKIFNIEKLTPAIPVFALTFIMLFPDAALQSLSAFVAHNVGARKLHRAKRALVHTIWMNLAFSCLMSILSFFNGTILTGIFTSDPAIMVAAADYLKAFAIDCFLCSTLFGFIGYLNGCGRTGMSFIQGIVGVAVRIPAAFFPKSISSSLFVIGLATPVSTTVQNILCLIYFLASNRMLTQMYEGDRG